MKWRNSYAVVAGCAVVGLTAFNAQAQSAFAGFYGQVSTGYESNQLGSLSGSATSTPNQNSDNIRTSPSQTFGGAPLVLGAGYSWQASEKWLIGVGVDYSALTQTSSNIPINHTNAPGNNNIAGQTTGNGASMQLSNRFNLFVSPGYAIDKDKLAYLKAGYSQVTAQYNRETSITRTLNGVSTAANATGGSQSSNQGGYLIGLGYKQIITSGLYGFVEGNYMSYSNPSYSYSSTKRPTLTLNGVSPAGTSTVYTSFANLNTYQFLIGLGYAF
jgi:outer membrane immunogenic protein